MTLITLVITLQYYHSQNLEGAWDEFYCRIWISSTIKWTVFMTSTYNLILITADRFSAVMFPIMYRNTNTMVGLVIIPY